MAEKCIQGGDSLSQQHEPAKPKEQSEAQTKSVSSPGEFSDSRPSRSIRVQSNLDFSRADDEYFMRHAKRGLALVFNHYEFDTRDYRNGEQYRPPKRQGTDVDKKAILRTFSNLGFEVQTFDDKCHRDIKKKLADVADQDLSEHDCLAVVVLTHGEDGGRLDAKDREYDHRDLWEPFTATNCPTLASKPKLFFIQACRGRTRDHGLFLRNAVGEATDTTVFIPPGFQVPSFADFLISFSTFEGQVAYRHPTRGSWYVQTLCAQLDRHAASKDLVSLLTDVNRIVGREFRSVDTFRPHEAVWVQGPCFISSLTRRLHLWPPVPPAAEHPALHQ